MKPPLTDAMIEEITGIFAALGDDLPDLPLLRQVGLACCPADAVAEVREACHLVVPVQGGAGVLRPVAERILKAQGCWEAVLAGY